RDIRLYSFLAIINEPNYDPVNGEGRRSVRYIHVYEDETFKIFDSTDTDFTLEFTLPEQFLIKEKTFTTEMRHQTALEVNNTIRNRIIQDDDPNNPLGNPDYTSKGALVDSITDFNAWDGYPFARVINDGNANDRRELYDLDERRDPEIYRHNGPYVPIMKTLSLFRPTSYWALTESSEEAEIVLNSNNWKFYDDYSDGEQSGLILREFGYIDEFIFSKVNLGGNILKLARLSRGDANRTDLRSIYPIVDEYGYDFTERYIFQSTWDRFFYIESRKMQLPINEYPGKSGYAVYFNGFDAKLMVDDTEKFNVVADDYEFQYSNPPSLADVDFTTLDIMNLIDEASVEPINWTLGRSGVGELEFDSALKFTNSGEAYWEYNTNIRVFEGQEINMTVTAKSNEGDNRMKFYCGIRQYNNNYNGKTQGGSSVTESVGTNDGHIYFVANAEVLTTAYTTYSGTYTVASGVS
ncbi:MAG: hypothetical protein ACC656_09200, partial [Candidatus Heimdallarchaeota archaeon]